MESLAIAPNDLSGQILGVNYDWIINILCLTSVTIIMYSDLTVPYSHCRHRYNFICAKANSSYYQHINRPRISLNTPAIQTAAVFAAHQILIDWRFLLCFANGAELPLRLPTETALPAGGRLRPCLTAADFMTSSILWILSRFRRRLLLLIPNPNPIQMPFRKKQPIFFLWLWASQQPLCLYWF